MVQEEKRIKISVVIPVYNVERYLAKCLESVIDQTLEEIEIIVVNDGSRDRSLELIQAYASKDSRIRVIDKENSGYGDSMNRGLAAAEGEYIGIVESDDFIAPEMYETLYALSGQGTVDVVKGNFYDYYESRSGLTTVSANQDRAMMEDSEEPFNLKENGQIAWGHPSVWSGIYRRKFLEDNGIRFLEEKGGGWVDNPFFYETICKAESIMWTSKAFYYYRKDNPTSSSNRQPNPMIPFQRMMENLDILERENYRQKDLATRCTYARALMYLTGAVEDFDYDANELLITKQAQELMRRMDEQVFLDYFNLRDQLLYYTYASSLPNLLARQKKVLIYNWLPFDNKWNRGGGVTVYCRNLIEEILRANPEVSVYFLSSGFAYDATRAETFTRKIGNIFGDRVHQHEIVNSPVPAEQKYVITNPLVTLENGQLKEVFLKFIETYGPFEAIHFNNIEGLSLDVLDLKKEYPGTKFIYSLHNYVPVCLTGFYYMRHRHCVCSPHHTGADCRQCSGAYKGSNFADEMYDRGKYGKKPGECISKTRWLNQFSFERLDQPTAQEELLKFAERLTEKINQNCDTVLAVSRRVYDIAAENGFDKRKMQLSYIGTKIAGHQLGHSGAQVKDGLKIVFLGNDIDSEEKGYPFLLDALNGLEAEYASRIDMVLTVRQKEHAEIDTMLAHFRSVKIIEGYTHDELADILEGCHLSIVPVLWEDNLPQIAVESVALGVPVLASDAGGASELCDDTLFRFQAGNGRELRDRIIHFMECPEDLERYWAGHHGLMTMEDHWKEIAPYYGIRAGSGTVEMSVEEYSWLLREHEFLQKCTQSAASGKDISTETMLRLQAELEAGKSKIKELEAIKMQREYGKVIFQTEYDPSQGDVGANLFSLTLADFNYSDFYAEIKFVKLENIGPSLSDTLSISGTWYETGNGYILKLHQIDWAKGDAGLRDWIYFYIRKNAVYFFGRFPGRACGYSYAIETLTSRAEKDKIKFEALSQLNVYENEARPLDVVNRV